MPLYDAYGRIIAATEHPPSLEQGHEKEHSESTEEQTTTKTAEPPQRPVSLDHPVSAPNRHSDSYEEKHYRLQKRGVLVQALLCIFTALAFGAAAYYAHVAHLQVGVMQQQLEATDRPWVKIMSAEPASQYSLFEENHNTFRARVNISLRIKNVGRSIASDISIMSRLTFTTQEEQLLQEQKIICDPRNPAAVAAGILSGGWPPTSLFPGDESEPFEIQSTDMMQPGIIAPKFIGCVEYLAPGNMLRHYSYFIYRIETREGINHLILLEAGDSIRPKDLILKPEPYGFNAQ